ncbi:MAG TPA: alpha/beta fold hydrolase [Bacillota bacterium]|nr:alpha/beta fold hydrolase [Bacillota bacterium]
MILFVHGMGHSDDRMYWKEWAGPLRAALSGEGLDLGEDRFGGVYYYDLVPRPGMGGSGAESIRTHVHDLKERAVSEFSLARAGFAGSIEAVKKLSQQVVDNFGDIFAYLYLEKIHRSVNDRVYEAIGNSAAPAHLVGYSLGSVVCYCALKENPAAARRVAQLIMVGSPLFWLKRGVAEHADLDSRPETGRFVNIAGILDIAWPQAVPGIIKGLDSHVEFSINPFDPIKGHREYFSKEQALKVIAGELKKGWL